MKSQVPLFTLWLIYADKGLPTIQYLTREEGEYLVAVIKRYAHLEDDLFYADDPPNNEGLEKRGVGL